MQQERANVLGIDCKGVQEELWSFTDPPCKIENGRTALPPNKY